MQPGVGPQAPFPGQPGPVHGGPKRASPWPWVGVGVLGVVVAAGLVLLFLFGRGDAGTPVASVTPAASQETSPKIATLVPQRPEVEGDEARTQCFTVTIPAGRPPQQTDQKVTCRMLFNLNDADALTAIRINPERNTPDAAAFVALAEKEFGDKDEFIGAEVVEIDGREVGLARLKDSNLEYRSYYIPQNPHRWEMDGSEVSGYVVMGYGYNAALRAELEGVVASLKFR